jgi:prepilin-type N-terminal cleavage/methylation domain-containing protein
MSIWNGFRKPLSRDKGRPGGFSLVEVSMVVAITLIAASITIPNMLQVISNARLHAGVTSMSGLLQSCRMSAVKNNRTLTTHFTPDGDKLVGYVKEAPLPDTTPRLATDLQAEWEAPVQMMTTPTGDDAPDEIDTVVLGFTPETGEPSFNTRGLPCAYDDDTGNCPYNGFLYYFKDTSRSGGKGWAALSISPAGRIKKWFWNTSAWVD